MSQSNEQAHLIHDHEDPDGLATWAIGLGGAFLMITTVAIACGIYYSSASTEAYDKSVNVRFEYKNTVLAEQQARLDAPAHIISVEGATSSLLVIPISDAMDAIVEGAK